MSTNFLPSIRTPALKRHDIVDVFTLFQDGRDATVIPTDHMFKAMMEHLLVQQLERLDIEHVVFEDEIVIPELDAMSIEGQVLPKDVPFARRFLESLTSLKHLEYWVADERFLSLLDYPVIPSFGRDGQVLHDCAVQVPSRHLTYLPTLYTLHLHGHAAEMCPFVDMRARVHSTIRKPIPIVVHRTA